MLKNMSKNQKLILFGIIIAMVILLCIMIFNLSKKDDNKNKIVVDNTTNRVSLRDEWYSVSTCANKFFLYYSNTLGTSKIQSDDQNSNNSNFYSIYDFLDNEYTEKYGITKSNIAEKLTKISDNLMFINDIYRIQKRGDINLYIVKSSITKKLSEDSSNFDILIKIDSANKTFSVFLDNYIKDMEYDKLKIGDKKDIELGTIKSTLYGIYTPSFGVTDDTYAEDLFDDYIDSCLYNKSRAYELLDDSVKKQKFPTLDSYIEYLKKKTVSLITNEYKRYSRIEENGYVKYTCIDNAGNMYVFKEIAPMKYTVEI